MNACNCNNEDFPCDYCTNLERQAREAIMQPCSFCNQDCEYGVCGKQVCRELAWEENMTGLIEENKWEVHDDQQGEPNHLHEWNLEFDADVDTGDAVRTCNCGRIERQNLYSIPELPNCYVPGYGWMVV